MIHLKSQAKQTEYRSIITGFRRRTINNLRQKYDVNIQLSNSQTPSSAVVPTPSVLPVDTTEQHDDQQAAPEENHSLSAETLNQTLEIEILITGYEDKTLACRDEIFKLAEEFDSTMEIDSFVDHLLVLEEDFLEDTSFKQQTGVQPQGELNFAQQLSAAQHQHQQQEVPSSNNIHLIKPTKHNKQQQQRQAQFQVKNAPWGANEQNGFKDEQQQKGKYSRQRNGHKNSPRKGSSTPHPGYLGKILSVTVSFTPVVLLRFTLIIHDMITVYNRTVLSLEKTDL